MKTGGGLPIPAALLSLLFVLCAAVQAATVTVDTLTDVEDGDTSSVLALTLSPGPDGCISLREAIIATNNTTGPDTIDFSVSGTMSLYNPDNPVEPKEPDPYPPLPPLNDTTGGTTITGLGADILLDGGCDWKTGLELNSAGNLIEGLSFLGWRYAIKVAGSGAGSNWIRACTIRTVPLVGSTKAPIYGIHITGLPPGEADGNIIGGTEPWMSNTILGYGDDILLSSGSDYNIIQGNYIGINESVETSYQNVWSGVHIAGSRNNMIGGTLPEERNFISRNGDGILVFDDEDNGTIIQGNYIGLNASRTSVVGNERCGIRCLARGVQIGGSEPGAGNIIVGCAPGIEFHGDFGENAVIQGNYIGTNPSGTLWSDGAEGVGVVLEEAYGVILGGAGPGEGNVIAGNPGAGIYTCYDSRKSKGVLNRILGNTIGLPGLGNGGPGILAAAGSLEVGGEAAGEANVIAHNGGAGIEVLDSSGACAVLENSIHGNAGRGIVLSAEQAAQYPAPVIASLWPLSGTAAAGVTVRVYADEEDEGRVYLGKAVADAGGAFVLDLDLTPYVGMNVTATSTWADGTTSEFSAPVAIEGEGEGEGDGEGDGEGEGEGEGEGHNEGEGEGPGEGEAEAPEFHSADQNQDNRIVLSELLRVIQFYNVGAYQCGAGTEDGYAPGAGATACTPHSSDYNPQDWIIDISELLRLIQFYNSPGYYACTDGEDGFCPGGAGAAM